MNSLFLTILLIVWAAQCMGQPNYADSILTEQLGRGVAAVKADAGSVFVTWRYLESDERDVAFNVYRDGVKLNQRPITDCTYYIDYAPSSSEALYEVRPAHDNCPSPQGTCTLPAAAPIGYIDIPREGVNEDYMARLPHYCAALSDLCTARGIHAISGRSLIPELSALYCKDHIHFNEAGSAVFAGHLLNSLRRSCGIQW